MKSRNTKSSATRPTTRAGLTRALLGTRPGDADYDLEQEATSAALNAYLLTRSGEARAQALALEEGAGISWAASVLSFGAVVAITSVILVILYGQTRGIGQLTGYRGHL